MPNARVGAMPQPNNHQNNYPPGRGTWRNRAQQGGCSIEDLKRQTAIRLAQENPDDAYDYATSSQRHPPQQHQHNRGRYSSIPQYGGNAANMSPNPNVTQQYSRHDYTTATTQQTYSSHHYSSSPRVAPSRNYTDAQLGLGGGGRGGGQPLMQQYPPAVPSSMRSPNPQQYQQQRQYGTPRAPDHELALKDRGSAENSDASDGEHHHHQKGYNGHLASKGSYGSSNTNSTRSHDRGNVKPFKGRGKQSPYDERGTPVRDGNNNIERQQIIFSPNQRDIGASTPTSVYSEPSRHQGGHRSQPNSPHHIQGSGAGARQNIHQGGFRPRPKGNGHYSHQRHGAQGQNKMMPHGLTVQELKEMTRARLAADGDVGEVSSVHSGGTHGSSSQSGSAMYANVIPSQSSEPLTRNLVQTNDSIRLTQSFTNGKPSMHQYQQQQTRQYQYSSNPRHPSPVFGASSVSSQFNNAMQSPKPISPSWETGSVASTLASEYQDVNMLTNSGGGGANMPFASPMSWAGGEGTSLAVNRSRCHSAEASPIRPTGGVVSVPLSADPNRRRCLTTSPMARMDRVNEDSPFWFSDGDKQRLAIPQLSQRRGIHLAPSAFSDTSSSPPVGSAFQPIGKEVQAGLPFSNQRPLKLSTNDRLMSMESHGHGELPSSMAEAVLNSLTGAPPNIGAIGGELIGSSPFRPLKNQQLDEVGESPFRALNDNILSASGSGSESLLSSGESNRVILATHSWGGGGNDEATSNNMSLSHDFNTLLNIGEPAASLSPLRGRANTDPVAQISSPLPGFPQMDSNSNFSGQHG